MTDFGDTTWPKGAKDHRCEWCGEKIPKGETHARFVGKWDGEFQNWRMHRDCFEATDKDDLSEGFTPYEHARGGQLNGC
jgi:hypothetical protein